MASLLSRMERDLYLEPGGSPAKIPFGVLKRVVQFSPSRNTVTCCLFHGWLALPLSVGVQKGMQ